ncbi:hypothetical protein OAR28_04405 [Amylibacter sp.]|nr:hypothetical protein [Amylibacter sp.]
MKTQSNFNGNFIDRIFRLIYAIWNKASLAKLKESNGGEFDISGFSKLRFLESDKKALDEQLAKIQQRAVAAVDFYNGKSVHNLSNVGNMPLSLESLATKEEIDNLSKITKSILVSNPEIGLYLGLEIPQLSLDLTVLCNTTSPNSVDRKVGSQNYHRDVYHSFYRGIKIFYGYNYSEDPNDGAFSYIPLTSIGPSVKPSKKSYTKKIMNERRFDLHPLIVNALPKAQILKEKELTAIDTYNCFHSGGHINTPGFIRLIFQIVVSPPQTPDRFSDITNSHLGRMFYFNMIKIRNIFRTPKL